MRLARKEVLSPRGAKRSLRINHANRSLTLRSRLRCRFAQAALARRWRRGRRVRAASPYLVAEHVDIYEANGCERCGARLPCGLDRACGKPIWMRCRV